MYQNKRGLGGGGASMGGGTYSSRHATQPVDIPKGMAQAAAIA